MARTEAPNKNSSEVFDSLTVCFNSTNCNGQNGELLAKRHKWMYVEFTNIQLTHYQYVIIFTSQTNFTCYLHFVPSNSPHWCIIDHPEFTFVHLDHFKNGHFLWQSLNEFHGIVAAVLLFCCYFLFASKYWPRRYDVWHKSNNTTDIPGAPFTNMFWF